MKAGIRTRWARHPETCKPDTYKRTPVAGSTNTTSSWSTPKKSGCTPLKLKRQCRRSTKQHELIRAGWREPSHPEAKPAPNSGICAEDLYNNRKSQLKAMFGRHRKTCACGHTWHAYACWAVRSFGGFTAIVGAGNAMRTPFSRSTGLYSSGTLLCITGLFL